MQVKSCVTLFLELILMLQERLRDNLVIVLDL